MIEVEDVEAARRLETGPDVDPPFPGGIEHDDRVEPVAGRPGIHARRFGRQIQHELEFLRDGGPRQAAYGVDAGVAHDRGQPQRRTDRVRVRRHVADQEGPAPFHKGGDQRFGRLPRKIHLRHGRSPSQRAMSVIDRRTERIDGYRSPRQRANHKPARR